jgi:drug/metabolite transporter (DMT)-like permease
MLFFAFVTGELSAIWARWHELANSFAWPVVIFSGFLAFSLNICSLLANKATSPLTLTVVANVKQVLMIVLSTILYSTPVSHLNAIGILVVIIGSARYSYEGLRDEQRSQKPLTPPASSSSTAGG